MFRRHLFFITIVLLIGANYARSQDSIKLDSMGVLPASLIEKLKLYQTTGDYKAISAIKSDSHPFFKNPSWVEASVNYRGQANSHQQVLYDLFQDVVFLAHPTTGFPVSLNPRFLEWFLIDGHYFQKVEGKEGYFELLYDSEEITLYKKHEKSKVLSLIHI